MWFAGLRGAMAYALALSAATALPGGGQVILITTLVYSLITILGLGTVLHPVLTWADVKNKPKPASENDESNNCINRVKNSLSSFDTNYFSPLFISDTKQIELRDRGRSESYAGSDTLSVEAGYLG